MQIFSPENYPKNLSYFERKRPSNWKRYKSVDVHAVRLKFLYLLLSFWAKCIPRGTIFQNIKKLRASQRKIIQVHKYYYKIYHATVDTSRLTFWKNLITILVLNWFQWKKNLRFPQWDSRKPSGSHAGALKEPRKSPRLLDFMDPRRLLRGSLRAHLGLLKCYFEAPSGLLRGFLKASWLSRFLRGHFESSSELL